MHPIEFYRHLKQELKFQAPVEASLFSVVCKRREAGGRSEEVQAKFKTKAHVLVTMIYEEKM